MSDTEQRNDVEALLQKASQAASARNLEEAERYLMPVLDKVPNHVKALDLLGFVRFFQKRYPECEQLCRRVLDLEPGRAYALNGLGMALARQGRLEEGLEIIHTAMEKSPTWTEPYWDAAVLLIGAKDYLRARAVLDQGLQNAPKGTARFQKLLAKIDALDGTEDS